MRILITGGAGFIGSTLARRLIAQNEEVWILDIKKEPRNLWGIHDGIRYVQRDIRDRKTLECIFSKRIDGVIHLAAVSRVIWGEQNPESCADINVNGTRMLLKSIQKSGQKPWIIFGSSREVYGEHKKLPVSEDFRKAPINIYGRTKLYGEGLVKEFINLIGLKCIILRFSNVYGNEFDILDRVIPRFVLSSIKGHPIEIHGGNQLVDFTHIDDTIEGIMKAIQLLNDEHPHFIEDFHILPGIGTTLQDVVDVIADYTMVDQDIQYKEPRNYDVDRFVGNPEKARRILGFRARIAPEEGIRKTVDLYAEVFQE